MTIDVLAWEAQEAENALKAQGFRVICCKAFPVKTDFIEDSWRVIRQRQLNTQLIEIVVAPVHEPLRIME